MTHLRICPTSLVLEGPQETELPAYGRILFWKLFLKDEQTDRLKHFPSRPPGAKSTPLPESTFRNFSESDFQAAKILGCNVPRSTAVH